MAPAEEKGRKHGRHAEREADDARQQRQALRIVSRFPEERSRVLVMGQARRAGHLLRGIVHAREIERDPVQVLGQSRMVLHQPEVSRAQAARADRGKHGLVEGGRRVLHRASRQDEECQDERDEEAPGSKNRARGGRGAHGRGHYTEAARAGLQIDPASQSLSNESRQNQWNAVPYAGTMSTKTQTTTTHYHIQKKRRAEFIEDWRKHRQSVIREEDVALVPTARGMRTGVYMGWDGDRPTRSLDALVHEVDPRAVTTIHRHSWDAILFMVSGSGWTEVDGVRYAWKPWDAIHIPAWSWHRHGNDRAAPAPFMSYSSEPT